MSRTLTLRPVTPSCGAEVDGFDLSQSLDESEAAGFRRALADNGVLIFRDQEITPEQHKALAANFGELHLHPAWPRVLEGHPEVMVIHTDKTSTRVAGEDWHSDVSCDAEPPLGTILYMMEVPPTGGDTLFANTVAAFEALSPALQRFLEGLTAVHDGAVYRGRYDDSPSDAEIRTPRSEHPLVTTHPVSGCSALYVNRIFTTHIAALDRPESDAILEMLFQHLARQEFQCRLNWEVGTVAFCDNRCTQHYAIWDYYPHTRHGHRVTITGVAPVFRP